MGVPAPDYFWIFGDSLLMLWGCSAQPGSLVVQRWNNLKICHGYNRPIAANLYGELQNI